MSLLLVAFLSLPALGGQAFSGDGVEERLSIDFRDGLFTIQARGVSLGKIIAEMEKLSGFSITVDNELKGRTVTFDLAGLDILKAVSIIVDRAGLGGFGATFEDHGPGRVVIVSRGGSLTNGGSEHAKAGALSFAAGVDCQSQPSAIQSCSGLSTPGVPAEDTNEDHLYTAGGSDDDSYPAVDNGVQEDYAQEAVTDDAGPFAPEPAESDCDYLSPGDKSYCHVCGNC